MYKADNSIFFEDRICNPVDSSLEQTEDAASDVEVHDRRNIDPLTTAALLLKTRAVRLEQFRTGEPEIDDISWHILLDLMVSTNKAEPVTVHDLAITHNLAINIISRYVDYLSGVGLIDKSVDADSGERGPLKLTTSGDTRASEALEKIGRELMNF